jgi:hypothetical protein
MAAANVDPEQPIAWRAISSGFDVRASDGSPAGTVDEVLGAADEDIFHGIVVKVRSGRCVFVPADYVTAMTASHVDVGLTLDELAGLPEHTEEQDFEVGWVGVFHKHLGWIRDKRS